MEMSSSSTSVLEMERGTPAVKRGWLVEDIGIETLGGVFTPLLPRGQSVPCEVTETFSTAADNQERLQLQLFRGTAELTRDVRHLGMLVVEELPAGPRGTVMIDITFSVTADAVILIAAREQSGHAVRLQREPSSTHSSDPVRDW